MGKDAIGPNTGSHNSPGRRLYGAVENRLGRAILSGDLVPGQLLSPDIDSARELKISRTSYREAIRALVDKGLVERKPQSGTRVLARERWDLLDPDVIEWAFTAPLDVKYVRSLMDLREIVAPVAARKAAQLGGDRHIANLRQAVREMRSHGYWSVPGRCAEQAFNEALLRSSGNEVLSRLSGSIQASIGWTRRLKEQLPAIAVDLARHYTTICDAVRDQKADVAESEMRKVIEASTQGIDTLLIAVPRISLDQNSQS